MREVPYIRWRWSEFLSGRISRRPAIEQAVFHLLVGMICQKGDSITLGNIDHLDLAERTHASKAEILAAIEAMKEREIISVTDGLVSIKFLDEEFERIRNESKSKKDAAKVRWDGRNAHAQGSDAPASKNNAHASNSMQMHNPAMQNDAPFSEREGQGEGERQRTISSPTPSGGGEDVWIPKPTPEAVAAAAPWNGLVNPNALPRPLATPPSNPHLCTIYGGTQLLNESESFRRFWVAYPKKDGKAAAAIQWNKAVADGVDPEYMIYAATREPSANKTGEDAKYRPAPAKWIEDGKFLSVPKPRQPEAPPAPPTAEEIAAREAAAAERERKREETQAMLAKFRKQLEQE